MSQVSIPIEYSAVRGLSGFTPPSPRSGQELLHKLKNDYLAPEGIKEILKQTFLYLAPAIAIGAGGTLAGAALFRSASRLLGHRFPRFFLSPHRVLNQHRMMVFFDEVTTAIFTGAFRSQATEESYGEAYAKDLGEGLIARIALLAGLRHLSGIASPILLRGLLLPTLMASGAWMAEMAIEEEREMKDLVKQGAGWEFADRWIRSFAMMHVQGNLLLRGPRFLGLPFSFHADDWKWVEKRRREFTGEIDLRRFFLKVSLKQGTEASLGLSRIIENLSANANISIQGKPLSDGLEITVSDNGIKEGNLVELDQDGVASIISTLRSLGWGPLWVRSEKGVGTEFRFNIPAEKLEWIDERPATPKRTELALEKNLGEGFIVPAASMDLAVGEVFKQKFWMARCVDLHQLLCGVRGTGKVQAVENGPASSIDLSLLLAMMRTRVVVKEPEWMRTHQREIGRELSEDLRSYIIHEPETNKPTPSEIVYWAHPSKILEIPEGMSLEDYMGRDVEPGGYLVIQTDHMLDKYFSESNEPLRHFLHLSFDEGKWEEIYRDFIPCDAEGRSRLILPTLQPPRLNFYLQIYRRRPTAA